MSTVDLDEVIQRIVETASPIRIILFGSAARGGMGYDSNLDLMVVMPAGVHRRKTAQAIYENMRGIRTPVDIVVATTQDLLEHGDDLGLIYRTVLKEGKEVYAA
jgi:predicted nucleotidyltransferase